MTRLLALLALACSAAEDLCVADDQVLYAPSCAVFCVPPGYGLAPIGADCSEATQCMRVEAGERVAVTRNAWVGRMPDGAFSEEACKP